MKKNNQSRIERARKYFNKIRQIVSQKPSPFTGMTKEEAIAKMRKTREEIWEKKLVTHP